MKFVVQVTDDPSYTRIMEALMKTGSNHSKESHGGVLSIEIEGTVNDYKHFESEVNAINAQRGMSVASIVEAL